MFFPESKLSPGRLLFVVEAGNTTTSFVVFKGCEILEVLGVSTKSLSDHDACRSTLEPIIRRYPELCDAAICSVVPFLEKITEEYLRHHLTGTILTVSASLILPFKLHYVSPASFGADRLALCAMSQSLYPEDAVIALDLGTAITVDVLSSTRHYLGGLIMPGLDLMAKALHEYTARLPLVALERPETLLGCSTVDGIRNGIIHGTVSSLDGLIEKIQQWLDEKHHEKRVRVLATGGNAPFLASVLSSPLEVEELAVVKGTRYLFSLNAEAPD
ncbi:MAG: type III pantothenate kinase [Chlorobium sp.]